MDPRVALSLARLEQTIQAQRELEAQAQRARTNDGWLSVPENVGRGIGAGFDRLGSQITANRAALAAAQGNEEEARRLLQQARLESIAASADDTQFDGDMFSSPGAFAYALGGSLGESSGATLGSILGGAAAGGAAGGAGAGPLGAAAGGLGGAALGSFIGGTPTYLANNLLAQLDTRGPDTDVNYGQAALAAVGQSAVDSLLLGRFGKLPGMLGEGAARGVSSMLGGSLARTAKDTIPTVYGSAAGGALRGALEESAAEVITTALERAQADLSLTSSNALSEYGQAAAAGAAMGGVFGGVTGFAEGRELRQRETDRLARLERETAILAQEDAQRRAYEQGGVYGDDGRLLALPAPSPDFEVGPDGQVRRATPPDSPYVLQPGDTRPFAERDAEFRQRQLDEARRRQEQGRPLLALPAPGADFVVGPDGAIAPRPGSFVAPLPPAPEPGVRERVSPEVQARNPGFPDLPAADRRADQEPKMRELGRVRAEEDARIRAVI